MALAPESFLLPQSAEGKFASSTQHQLSLSGMEEGEHFCKQWVVGLPGGSLVASNSVQLWGT